MHNNQSRYFVYKLINFKRTDSNRSLILKMKLNFNFQTNGSKFLSKNMKLPCTNQTIIFQYPKKIVLWEITFIFKISQRGDSILVRLLELIHQLLMSAKYQNIEISLVVRLQWILKIMKFFKKKIIIYNQSREIIETHHISIKKF